MPIFLLAELPVGNGNYLNILIEPDPLLCNAMHGDDGETGRG